MARRIPTCRHALGIARRIEVFGQGQAWLGIHNFAKSKEINDYEIMEHNSLICMLAHASRLWIPEVITPQIMYVYIYIQTAARGWGPNRKHGFAWPDRASPGILFCGINFAACFWNRCLVCFGSFWNPFGIFFYLLFPSIFEHVVWLMFRMVFHWCWDPHTSKCYFFQM